MIRRHFLAALAAFVPALAAIVQSVPAAAQPATGVPGARHKVIFHVGDADPAKWTVAFNNVFNVRKDLGAANVDIEVVAINAGIRMLKLESPESSRIADAIKGGVKVVACENSMKGQSVTRDDMLAGIGYVPAGVVELMDRQREGYAYIRP
jgi:intracellular sulfur oxidation DsrE/DsrF family protein